VRRTTISKTVQFAAAHNLPQHQGKCNNLHGHTYEVTISVTGPIQAEMGPAVGMVMDFAGLNAIIQDVIVERFDHKNLNIFFHNPTTENLAQHIFTLIEDALTEYKFQDVKVKSVRVKESPSSEVIVEAI
jgi:6-pyruvoyltetrahydropterin/6-carboxytetrahydropterin synthase